VAADQLLTQRRIEEATAIVEESERRGAQARALGGVAVVIHCGSAHRAPEDIDLAVGRSDLKTLTGVLAERGYEPNDRFNAMHGDTRNLFQGPAGKLDVFVGAFTMCHRLELESRLAVDHPTLSVADLILTKLQIVELTEKDSDDLRALLKAHELGSGPGDVIDADRIAAVLADDWGYWRTATETLGRVASASPELGEMSAELRRRIDEEPKTRRFKLRARIGERRRWYELPEIVGG
jgi:hypothetical protein